jgi:hypothetical protein
LASRRVAQYQYEQEASDRAKAEHHEAIDMGEHVSLVLDRAGEHRGCPRDRLNVTGRAAGEIFLYVSGLSLVVNEPASTWRPMRFESICSRMRTRVWMNALPSSPAKKPAGLKDCAQGKQLARLDMLQCKQRGEAG